MLSGATPCRPLDDYIRACVTYICDDGFLVALLSALARNTTLQMLNLAGNHFGVQGFMVLAKSLPIIKALQQIDFTANASFQSALPLSQRVMAERCEIIALVFPTGAVGAQCNTSYPRMKLSSRGRLVELTERQTAETAAVSASIDFKTDQ
jgi:hypothetical protein